MLIIKTSSILFVLFCDVMKLFSETKEYLLKITNAYEKCPHGPEIIHTSPFLKLNTDRDRQPTPMDYLLPSVILWDPLKQFENSFSGNFFCPKTSHSAKCAPLRALKWKNGIGVRDDPRKLYGKDRIILLVSRVYVCSEGHEIIAHDPVIIDNIPSEFVPFYLSHKSGVTMDFANSIQSLANAGLNFTEIERSVAQEYYNSHWLTESKFKRDVECYTKKNSSSTEKTFLDPFPSCKEWIELPSDDIIIGCFILHFEENKVFYTKRMCDLSAVYLSADHTFKVAANIGIRLSDSKWVIQYDSLYCILNEKGQVVAWQLTKGTAFKHVEGLFQALKTRLDDQNAVLEAIYIDNCCHVQGKLTKVFGNVPVKLDLFHAIARVTQKMSKQSRHYMTNSCISDFVNVFRDDTDKEKERKEKTPPAEQIQENLNGFLRRWTNIRHGNEESVLTSAVINEIECLRKHIQKGCLSNIPPGAGSERNENLHRNLKHIIARSRLGVKSALALLTSFFYQWNERKEDRFVKGIVPPISYYAENTFCCNPPNESFGIRNSVDFCSETKENVSKFLGSHVDVFKMHSILQPECTSDLDAKAPLKEVLTKSLNYLLVKEEITAMSNSRSLNIRLIHLMPCSLTLFSNSQQCMVRNPQESRMCLEKLLSEYGLQIKEQPDNIKKGNSFFFSVVTGLSNILQQVQNFHEEHDAIFTKLQSITITANPDKTSIDIETLRKEISKEWEQNLSVYKKLLITSDLNLTEEINKYTLDGYFTGELGNLLALAAAKITQFCIIIFSSLEHIPIVPVVPVDPAVSSRCILIGFNVASGTYYSIVKKCLTENAALLSRPSTSLNSMNSDRDIKGCNCGRGAAKKESNRQFCRQIVGGLPSRCVCYINMTGCSHKCHCCNCNNPYGSSVDAKAIYPLTRVRHSTKLKGQKNRSDANFLLENEVVPLLGWNNLESMFFDCLVDFMVAENLEIEATACLAKFNELRNISSEQGITCIASKSLKQIQGKLTNIRKCAAVFEAIYKKQIELNWFKDK